MSILETFYILFEADASELEKENKKLEKSTEKAEDSLRKLRGEIDPTYAATSRLANQQARLDMHFKAGRISSDEYARSTEAISKNVKKLEKDNLGLSTSFRSVAQSALAALTAMISIGAVVRSIFASANYADKLGEQAEALGISIETLESWSEAVKRAGGSPEGLIQSISSLNERLADLNVKGKGESKEFFDKLGVSIRDTNGKIRTALDLLPDLADAFAGLGNEEALGLGRKLGLDQGTVMLLRRGRDEVEAQIRRQKELGTVTEQDAKAAGEFNDALDDTNQVFRVFFSQVAGDVLPVLTAFLGKIQDIGQWMQDHEGFIYGFLIGASVILGVILVKTGILVGMLGLLTAPVLLAIGAIVAFGFAFGIISDDFKKFFEGAPSIVGVLVDAFKNVAAKIKAIWSGLIQWISNLWEKIMGPFKAVAGFIKGTNDEDIAAAQKAINNASQNPMAGQTSESMAAGRANNKNTEVNIGEVTVQTQATDANGISAEIGRSLQSEMSQTAANFDDGIRG